jgi:putative membrane protein
MNIELMRYAGLATLAACVVLGGCKAKDNSATDTTSTMSATATGDTSAMGGAAKAGDTTAGASGAALSDANIAALVDEANVGDSTLAASALPKLTSTGAKDFAKLMMGEHHAIHVQGLQVEKAQNITPQLPTPDPFKPAVEAEQTALGSMSKGAAYDSTYIAHEVGIHQAVLDWAGKNTPQNAAYQQYLKTAGPVYQKHLDHALALQKKMSGSKA